MSYLDTPASEWEMLSLDFSDWIAGHRLASSIFSVLAYCNHS